MNWKAEYKTVLGLLGFFLVAYLMPIQNIDFKEALFSAFELTKWYAQEHVILCLIPAFFIAGVIAVFVSQAAVIKYFGAGAKKWLSYAVASVSGTILAVCSCTILPLFSGSHKRGAGLGPAIAFLYSGPAINILAIILTARILGFELGLARVIGAVSFSIVIGLIMAFIYRREDKERSDAQLAMPDFEEPRPIWQTALHFSILIALLIFVNWSKPADTITGVWYFIFTNKWIITSIFGISFALSMIYIIKAKKLFVILGSFAVVAATIIFYENPVIPFVVGIIATTLVLTFTEGEANQWLGETWGFTKQIMPLLGVGVLVAGFLLGSAPGSSGIIPKEWIAKLVGGNSLLSNFFASIVGAFMYFATLTEIPILQGLINSGMGKGPALALLLAGPALSLPNILVLRGIIGMQKTTVYVSLVILMATLSGLIYGTFL